MRKRILVLGAGRMGSIIAQDLRQYYEITLVDRDWSYWTWDPDVSVFKLDLQGYPQLLPLAKKHDLIVNALPANITRDTQVVHTAIASGTPLVDVSYQKELRLNSLDRLAKVAGIPILIDWGVAPGITNMITGRVHEEQGGIEEGKLYVGGVSADRQAPYGYRVTWSLEDLWEEYIRRARFISGNREVTRPALSGIEEIVIQGAGPMEAFLTDGLRTLLGMKNVRNLVEKTLRWPGHVEAVMPLINNGSLIKEFNQKCSQGEDLLVLYCDIDGKTFRLIERPKDGMSAMQRTTALTCASAARLAAECELPPGILPPETIGRDEGLYSYILDCLDSHDVILEQI
jgi:saccharopine dehydrogenase-like NADP-dependent oxidoreductase